MRVALFSSATGDKWALLTNAYGQALRERGIEIGVAVLDDQGEKTESRRLHALNVCKRQARIAGCSVPVMLARILTYKRVLRRGGQESGRVPAPDGVPTVHVATLNSDEAVSAVRSRECDLVCLMGTRIISKKTLSDLGVPVVNIHSSDPSFVRGGPPVVWEILDGKDSIVLTVHEVVEQVDAGSILRQAEHPISYGSSLGITVKKTMSAAKPKVAELFFQVIVDYQAGRLQRREFTPGVLRTTPSILETLRADRMCSRRRG